MSDKDKHKESLFSEGLNQPVKAPTAEPPPEPAEEPDPNEARKEGLRKAIKTYTARVRVRK